MIDNFKKTRNMIISKTHFISSHGSCWSFSRMSLTFVFGLEDDAVRFELPCNQECSSLWSPRKMVIEAIGQEWLYRFIPSKWGKRSHCPTRTCLIPPRVFIDTKCQAWS